MTDIDQDRRIRLLMTGFGPFPGVPVNATGELVARLGAPASERFPGCDVRWRVLPVAWQDGLRQSASLIADFDPDVIVHFGVSERAQGFVIETLARNACKASPDVDGRLPALSLLELDAPSGIAATLPCDAILARLRDAGLPAVLSDDAGGYLCNAVMFQTLRTARRPRVAGFVHLPVSLDGAERALSGDEAVRGGLEIIAAALDAV